MTREEELQAIEQHIRTRGVTTMTPEEFEAHREALRHAEFNVRSNRAKVMNMKRRKGTGRPKNVASQQVA